MLYKGTLLGKKRYYMSFGFCQVMFFFTCFVQFTQLWETLTLIFVWHDLHLTLTPSVTEDDWHLRKTNWCGEAADLLDDLDLTLTDCCINDGDTLLLERGKLPPKVLIICSYHALLCT